MPDSDENEEMRDHDRRPIPDPTVLTTRQLLREVTALKELVGTRLDAMDKAQALFENNLSRVPTETDRQIQHLKELHGVRFGEVHSELIAGRTILNTRMDAMDKAVVLLQAISDTAPSKIDEKIASLHGIHDEKFSSIGTQFRERDVRTEQSSKDSKVAVDAALQAAKEAVGEQNKSSALAIAKSEASTTKQIDQLGQLIQSTTKGVDDKFQDVKDRLTRIEGKTEGQKAADTDHTIQSNWGIGLMVAIVFGLLSFGVAMFNLMRK